MSDLLMTPADLERVTGKKRYSKQAEWFKKAFGVDVVRCGDGSIVMTWATFQSLNDRRNGSQTSAQTTERPPVYLLRKA
ncbi:DUF4224 domain-containing protein [Paraburkholderia ferrariae]|uniref:DUF4224 domain-containing protein n=1 Tax=Paraburkholderia ferrariae TaxID=386056 RepID=A0ABU9RYT5_9BURK